MCGRYSFKVSKEDLLIPFPEITLPDPWLENLNICPTEEVFAIRNESHHIQLSLMKWGFQNNGVSKMNPPLVINARCETIFDKKSFKGSILSNRCLIPADSFYEWGKYGKSKIPYRILPTDESVMFLAGIWKTVEYRNDLSSVFVIVTTEANEDVSDLHQRMPVLLHTTENRDTWLSPDTSANELIHLMKPLAKGYLKKFAISNLINQIKVKKGDLHTPVPTPLTLFN